MLYLAHYAILANPYAQEYNTAFSKFKVTYSINCQFQLGTFCLQMEMHSVLWQTMAL